MSRLPALGGVIDAAGHTARRFPPVLAAGLLAAVAAILAAEDVGPDWLHGRMVAAASLGLPLFTAVTLLAERRQGAYAPRMALYLGAAAALVGYTLMWPLWSEEVRGFRYAQLSIACHLMVAFLAFAGRDQPHGFWQFNRTLFVRFLTAGISSATLFGGLALALLALDKLFGVDVPEMGYFRLWVVLAFVFNTWYFLGGVPRDLDALEAERDYPHALRVFAQFILVPLVSLYLVILTLYLGKVLVTWDWPSGWIGWLVSGVATAGILALLLVYPIAEQEDQRWVRAFARDFWLAILPSTVMLWLALYQRLDQYGMTEPRYFLMVMSVWLFGAALYFRFAANAPIIRIPASLCLLALVTFAGPWSAYRVSERSQHTRLERLLTGAGVLDSGAIRRAAGTAAPDSSVKEINATVRYLVGRHGPGVLRPWLSDSVTMYLGSLNRPPLPGDVERRVEQIVAGWGVPYHSRWATGADQSEYRLHVARSAVMPVAVTGFDVLLPIADQDSGLMAVLVPDARVIRVRRDSIILIEVSLEPLLARVGGQLRPRMSHNAPVAAALLETAAENREVRAVVQLTNIEGPRAGTTPGVSNVTGRVLLDFKRP